ncbi:MAG: YoaK family protein [Clostridia bacterium]
MKIEKSETFIVGTFLAIAGGFLDGYTFICRGGIFANAQTGNMIFSALSLTSGDFYMALFYVLPVIFFAFGVFISEFMKVRYSDAKKISWQQISLVLEIIVLIVVSFIPSDDLNVWVNISIAIVCGIQVQSFRKLHGNAYATTMCTGNLRSASECMFYGFIQKDEQMKRKAFLYFCIIFIFLLGVLIGAFATYVLNEHSIIIAAIILAFPLIYIHNFSADKSQI